MILKIMTYNVHKGFNWNQKKYLLTEMKELISSTKAEIVCLQEVVGFSRSYQSQGYVDAQIEFFADEIWPHYSYAKNSIRDSGHHGNSILSAFPIMNWNQEDISTSRFEKRGILFCQIVIPNSQPNLSNTILNIICVHLDLFSHGRQKQYEMIFNYIQKLNLLESDPVIIAGDFNDWNQKATTYFFKKLNMVEAYFSLHKSYARTFPSFYPLLPLDRIYVKNLSIRSATVIYSKERASISDHLPLLIEVELNAT
jgi:endonuclease/exonuclease/phosphatase family metal-dependent hydrolase